MGRPWQLTWELARYLVRRRRWPKRGRLFPIVLMLEPLESCNLRCAGCGRIREYGDCAEERLSVAQCLAAADRAGAPVVSVSGGEPLLHPDIVDIVRGLLEQGRWVFLCTNGLLVRESLSKFASHPRLCWVVHLDGTEPVHDRMTGRPGTYREAVKAIQQARTEGFRVCTNTTVFHGADVADVDALFRELTALGVEGIMVSPGYAYEHVEERELFLQRQEAVQLFRQLLEKSEQLPFYDNPLFLDFLRGRRSYSCAAWAVPTYTVRGWREPCYLLADRHAEALEELFKPELWAKFGPGHDARCAGCMLHSGFEPASVFDALEHPWRLLFRRR